ncbi:MAG: hypothetical protein RL708_706 [Bacteroidota bacterium]
MLKANVFDEIKKIPPEQRITKSQLIYDKQVRTKDSVFAFQSVFELIEMAKQLHDKSLECFAISMLADHHARTNGYSKATTQLHLDAIKMADENNLPIVLGICNFKIGRYYYSFLKYPLAFEHLLRANNIFKEIGYDKAPNDFLFYLANIYYSAGDIVKADSFFHACLRYKTHDRFVNMQANNSLAAIAKQKNQLDKALQFEQQTLAIAAANNDSTWIGLSNGFIGNFYFLLHDYTKAKTFLQKGYMSNCIHNEWSNAIICALNLAAINIVENNFSEADRYLQLSNQCFQHQNLMKDRKRKAEVMALYYERKGNTAAALQWHKKFVQLQDSMNSNAELQSFNNIQLRIETEKHLSEIGKLEADADKAKLKRNAIILILCLLMFISLLLYNRRRLKTKAENEIAKQREALLQSEKLVAETELKNAAIQLQNFTENLRNKNELIEQFTNEIEALKKSTSADLIQTERVEHFEKLLQSTILTDEDWDNFRQLFEKVHSGFFFHLKEKFPNLTLTETRMCSLIKLQLSNREMANMVGISIDAIKKSKQRLRKKISPENEEVEIENLIATI